MFDRASFIKLGERFTQRITEKEWLGLLLNHEESIIHEGRVRKLNARSLGYGVVEVYMEPEQRR